MSNRLNFSKQYFPSIASTHIYLLNHLKTTQLENPIVITAKKQTNSIGSRGNSWISLEGNLFFSLAFDTKHLPADLKIGSSSIYMAMIMKLVLSKLGSKTSVKWPNDLYINEKKIAGIISKVDKNNLIVSMGINTKQAPQGFGTLDIDISSEKLLDLFLLELNSLPSWKNIFNEFRIEFSNNKNKIFHYKNKIYSFEDSILCNDGSLLISGEKVYSIR